MMGLFECFPEFSQLLRSATAGKVTGSAECDGIKKSINLVLKSLGYANKVEFYSDEVVYRGTSKYMAITIADGVVIIACNTNGRYSIIQKECQCQITIHLLFLTAQTTILQL